jgi:aminoglycoside phosphotransferase (APT) family kinase protein
MEGWLNHALQWWGNVGGGSVTEQRNARDAFQDVRRHLPVRSREPILFDGRPEHFLIRDGHLVGVIDLTDVRIGDGGMDLGVVGVSDPELLQNVMAGYSPSRQRMADLEATVPFYVFLRRLAAAEWHTDLGDTARAASILSWIEREPFPAAG